MPSRALKILLAIKKMKFFKKTEEKEKKNSPETFFSVLGFVGFSETVVCTGSFSVSFLTGVLDADLDFLVFL